MDPQQSKTTTDHDEIRRWVEERDGIPARVSSTGDEGDGILRINFRDMNEGLEEISWDDFFRIFEENNLAFLYEEETPDGEQSRFSKFVAR